MLALSGVKIKIVEISASYANIVLNIETLTILVRGKTRMVGEGFSEVWKISSKSIG